MRKIIIITGVPGTGKTTVSNIIAEKTNFRHLDISKLALKSGLIVDEDAQRETRIVDVNALSQEISETINSTDQNIVIEGHFAHELVDPDYVDLVFVLRRAPWELREELEFRDYPLEKVKENLEAEILGVNLYEALKSQNNEHICEIDTTHQSPRETSEEILSIIKGELPCLRGEIDWVSEQETMDLLREIGSCI